MLNANPLAIFDVSAGIVPAASEDMLNANELPEVETPSGALGAAQKGSHQRKARLRGEAVEVVIEAAVVVEPHRRRKRTADIANAARAWAPTHE
jgi:hypothetical protein